MGEEPHTTATYIEEIQCNSHLEFRPLLSAGGSLMGVAQATFSASSVEIPQFNFLSLYSSCYRGDKYFTRTFTKRPV